MAKYIIDLPEKLHDELRLQKIKQKKDMKDIVIDTLERGLKNGR